MAKQMTAKQAQQNLRNYVQFMEGQAAKNALESERKRQAKAEQKRNNAAALAAQNRREAKAQRAREERITEANFQGRVLLNNARIILGLVGIIVVLTEVGIL
jgi:capsid protein